MRDGRGCVCGPVKGQCFRVGSPILMFIFRLFRMGISVVLRGNTFKWCGLISALCVYAVSG